MSGINIQLKKIDKIAKDIEKVEEHEEYTKYKSIFDEAIKYIKKRKILLYGGMAINDLLPKKDKIYPVDSLPDIDIFSENGKKQSEDIVKYFIKKGYNKLTTNSSDALHVGTYKVFVDSVQVFDVTTVSKRAFKRLSENSVIGDSGIRIVNPQFLRLSLHMIMSQSHDARRWTKVFNRLIVFYKEYPPKQCKNTHTNKDTKTKTNEDSLTLTTLHFISEDIIKKIYTFISNKNLVLFGMNEIQLYMKNQSGKAYLPANSKIAPVQIIAQSNILDLAHSIVNHLNMPSFSISKIYTADEFIPEHIIIKYNTHPCVEIYNAPVCMTYIEYKNMKIASIHTIIRMYLSMVLSTYTHFENESHSLECLVNMLSIIQQNMIGSRKKIFQQLLEQCYGPYHGLISLRRQRVLRAEK
jgi:hypothetical protein